VGKYEKIFFLKISTNFLPKYFLPVQKSVIQAFKVLIFGCPQSATGHIANRYAQVNERQ